MPEIRKLTRKKPLQEYVCLGGLRASTSMFNDAFARVEVVRKPKGERTVAQPRGLKTVSREQLNDN